SSASAGLPNTATRKTAKSNKSPLNSTWRPATEEESKKSYNGDVKNRYTYVILLLTLLLNACSPQANYDIVIENGSLVDGSGSPARDADVGILDGKIAAIGDLASAGAARRIDASGLVVA